MDIREAIQAVADSPEHKAYLDCFKKHYATQNPHLDKEKATELHELLCDLRNVEWKTFNEWVITHVEGLTMHPPSPEAYIKRQWRVHWHQRRQDLMPIYAAFLDAMENAR